MMRLFLAGIITFFILTSSVMAQVDGFVESIGIGGHIRPDCWTPLVVNLTSQISEPMTYQIQVWQEDLDKDRVVFTKEITLSPKLQEKFEMYFVPQPTNGGLPLQGSNTSAGELQKALHVRLCLPLAEGKKPDDARVVIDRLPIKFTIDSLDPMPSSAFEHRTGTRLVLWVTDGSSKPIFSSYDAALGLVERVATVPVRPTELGENPLFYSSVDAVVWLSGSADELDKFGAGRREALEEFVRQGGKLIVCQPAERQKIEALAGLLPVETKDASGNWLITFSEKASFVDRTGFGADAKPIDALPRLAQAVDNPNYRPQWHLINQDGKHPISIARAQPKPDAVVAEWQDWSKTDHSPYIVRQFTWLGERDMGGARPW